MRDLAEARGAGPRPRRAGRMTVPNEVLGVALGFGVGIVLGLLGGGGSILAVPIFLYVFRVDPKPAIAMSLAVVGMSAFVGFLGHWRQGSVNLRVGLPFGVVAMGAAFLTARVSDRVPDSAAADALCDLRVHRRDRDAVRLAATAAARTPLPGSEPHFTPVLAIEAIGRWSADGAHRRGRRFRHRPGAGVPRRRSGEGSGGKFAAHHHPERAERLRRLYRAGTDRLVPCRGFHRRGGRSARCWGPGSTGMFRRCGSSRDLPS